MFAFPVVMAAPTTSVTITKLANDGTTILGQITVNVTEMMAGSPELPIYGDGVTKYYCQGPTFNLSNMWDSGIPPEPPPGETVNVASRNYGAAKGNDVKDLCEMLSTGGASPGDVIKIKAPDGFSKSFDYEDVYTPEPKQGKLIITWYTKDAGDGLAGERYVTDGSYTTGMRLLFFAETLSPEGKHVFGNWDMHETLAQNRWHYYYDGTFWPSSSGLSVKWVSDIIIYSSISAGDVNRDGLVDTFDLYALGRAYNSTLMTENWNPNADFTNDDIVDSADLAILRKNYGKSST
jgi:hypothetical protein